VLELRGLNAWYGDSHILHGIDVDVREGQLVTLLGRNGAGRTTTLKSIVGLVDRVEGSVKVRGRDVVGIDAHLVARLGVGYCPEERGIFAALTTLENLDLLPPLGSKGLTHEELYEMFPNLRERSASLGGRLSGGEQQMLAMARILRTGASLLLLDEITEGLAPVIVERLGQVVHRLKERGYTIVLVEQNLRFAEPLADRHYVLESGRVVDVIDASEVASRRGAIERLLSA
jgi:branched-chain amino acid transport system ATP-binding protein